MKLVEVVSGLHTDAAVAEAIFELSRRWGKTPVHARSTPGFIVNRIARPYYAETLALLHEQAATPQVLDACLRARRLSHGPVRADGPDRPRHQLRGHAVGVRGQLLRQALSCRRRVQREMVDGGLLGRKSGRGFYRYQAEAAARAAGGRARGARPPRAQVAVHGDGADGRLARAGRDGGARAAGLGPGARARQRLDRPGDRRRAPGAHRRPHAHRSWARSRRAAADVAVFDRPLVLPAPAGTRARLRRAPSGQRRAWRTQAGGLAGRARLHAAAAWPIRPGWSSRARWRC